jgi:glycosyltransferase involved in cell wall biosynthesis
VDCYLGGDHDQLPAELRSLPHVRVVNFDTGWRYDRWYSNRNVTKVLTGLGASAWGRRRLASLLAEQHRASPYDVVYQFSTIELFGLRQRLNALPPLVLHPETHAAGELRGMRSERHLAARCEPWWRRRVAEMLLVSRSSKQRRDIQSAQRVIAISRRFGEHLVADYGLDPAHITVVPNPIDLEALRPTTRSTSQVRHLVFVGRISVRKGVDLIVELSHRLADLEGQVVLDIVGTETLWSDYRPLLADLHPGVARVHGYLERPELIRLLATADVLVHPAAFEPFGLTVGEALACGVPVVATIEVGAAEDVSPECCLLLPPRDIDALEKAVREMLDRLDAGDEAVIRAQARAEAETLFAPRDVASQGLDVLVTTARREPPPA